MPIRRRNDNDLDWMAKKQDKELIYLEERISALYEEASYQITEEYNRFYSNYQQEYERRLAMVESGEMSQDSFNTWCRNQIFQSNRYQAMISSLTDVLTNADVAAMAAVNEQLPYTLAESYDFISSLGFEAADKAGITMGTFQIYNADSVREIIRQNPNLFPVVDLPEDEAWNRRHINNEIMQAIIQGDSMQRVARRLQSVAAMDNRAAIRNARTAMTAAENLGRSESARRLKEKGLPVKEVWSATKDSRTRNTHLLLDGTEKDDKGYYGADILAVPLRFPADPNGEPQEIYNCRCRENVQIAGIDHSRDDELYENFMRENYPEDWNELERRRADTSTGEGRRWQERQDALERQARLRAERQANQPMTQETVYDGLPILQERNDGTIIFRDNISADGNKIIIPLENTEYITKTIDGQRHFYIMTGENEGVEIERWQMSAVGRTYEQMDRDQRAFILDRATFDREKVEIDTSETFLGLESINNIRFEDYRQRAIDAANGNFDDGWTIPRNEDGDVQISFIPFGTRVRTLSFGERESDRTYRILGQQRGRAPRGRGRR